MRKHQILSLGAGLLAVGLFSVARAQEASAPKPTPGSTASKTSKLAATPLPRVHSDPAFKKFVDVRLLAPAIKKGDAGLLTDLALQFAVGESVLERPHKTFCTQDVAAFALAAATAAHDSASLDRLAKLAAKLNDSPLAAKIAVAKLDAGKSRSAEPPTMIALDSVTAEDLAGFQGVQNAIAAFKILGDRAGIERALLMIEKQNNLPAGLREQGILFAQNAMMTMPKDAKPSNAALAVEQLLAYPTRDGDDDRFRPRPDNWGYPGRADNENEGQYDNRMRSEDDEIHNTHGGEVLQIPGGLNRAVLRELIYSQRNQMHHLDDPH
jgi:hypothetical protein